MYVIMLKNAQKTMTTIITKALTYTDVEPKYVGK